jgi:hypothetical protein
MVSFVVQRFSTLLFFHVREQLLTESCVFRKKYFQIIVRVVVPLFIYIHTFAPYGRLKLAQLATAAGVRFLRGIIRPSSLKAANEEHSSGGKIRKAAVKRKAFKGREN